MNKSNSNILPNSEVDTPSLSNQLYNHLKSNEFNEAISLLKSQEHENYLKHNSLDFVPVISRVLQEAFCNSDTEECIEEILCHIASIANQKESLLVFLEEVEIFRSTKQFKVMLKPLQTILLRQVSTSAKSNIFSWVFTTLYAHISTLPIPKYDYLENEERKLLDVDPDQEQLVLSLMYLRDFYQVFYQKVITGKLTWEKKGLKSSEYLSYFILNLFHKPLAQLDVYKTEDEAESKLYSICKAYVCMISNLICDPFKYFKQIKKLKLSNKQERNSDIDEEKEKEAPDVVSNLSLAVYFYCIFGQKMNDSNFPHVYNSEFIFYQLIPLYLTLFEEKGSFAVHKGLVLLDSVLLKVQEHSLSQISLEIPFHTRLINNLIDIMTLNTNKECRILALKCFKDWIRKFESAGKYQLYTNILSTVTHPGILGVIIHEIKESIRLACKNGNIDDCFYNIKLQALLKLVCSLPSGETTDLLEWSDKIMGALNLLIFLCIYDEKNDTNFKPALPYILKEFLQPLENGLRISKAHYELKLKDLQEGKERFTDQELSVEINGNLFDGIPEENQKEVIIQSLNWFDILQSTWARANKLVDNCKL
ncbi:UNVERIFIED_CONTAM: hypothetical protein RMT77_011771 [Armadillidium vulgare]